METRRLKTLADVRPSNVDKHSVEGQQSVSLCNYTDVYYNDRISAVTDFMCATATDEQIKSFALRVGDVLVTKDSESPDDIGIPALVDRDVPAICAYHLALIRPKSSEVDGRYLFYALKSSESAAHFKVRAKGITRYALGVSAIGDTPIPQASREDQSVIADYLDEETARVDRLVAEKERFIALLAEKRAALITHAVTKGLDPDVEMRDSEVEWLGDIPAGWAVGRLSDLASEPIVYGIVLPGPHVEDGVPILRGCDLKAGHIDLDTLARTAPDIAGGFTRSQLHPGELVYSIRASWGDCVVVPDYLKGANITQDSVRIAPLDGVDVRWLKYLLVSDAVAEFVRSQLRGATIKGINVFDLRRCRVPAIRTCEQHAIADYLDRETALIDELADATRESITLLKEYRSTLISAAVIGKIDVSAYNATEGDSQ